MAIVKSSSNFIFVLVWGALLGMMILPVYAISQDETVPSDPSVYYQHSSSRLEIQKKFQVQYDDLRKQTLHKYEKFEWDARAEYSSLVKTFEEKYGPLLKGKEESANSWQEYQEYRQSIYNQFQKLRDDLVKKYSQLFKVQEKTAFNKYKEILAQEQKEMYQLYGSDMPSWIGIPKVTISAVPVEIMKFTPAAGVPPFLNRLWTPPKQEQGGRAVITQPAIAPPPAPATEPINNAAILPAKPVSSQTPIPPSDQGRRIPQSQTSSGTNTQPQKVESKPTQTINKIDMGYCGSTSLQVAAIPEYVCFSLEGGTLPYTACAVGSMVGYKPVYFGLACREHDGCYSRKGTKKSQCDKSFLTLLKSTCDETLTGKLRKLSRKNCYNVVSEYYHQVDARGCIAFKNAQKHAGNSNPICN